jgi:hypothetical protein
MMGRLYPLGMSSDVVPSSGLEMGEGCLTLFRFSA